MTHTFKPEGVCSTFFTFEIDDNIITDIKITGGCDGNLQGISSLLKGRSVDDVITSLDGILCKTKGTSCPDQIAKALKNYLETSAS